MPPGGDTALGVDIGGTRIRVARIARGGDILDRAAEPVRRDREGFADQLVRMLRQVRREGDAAVGIGVPGRVDAARGGVLSAGYLDIAGLDLAPLILRGTVLRTRVENDATMALVAESRLRPDGARGLVMMITVGTGVGGAVGLDGAPWYGGGLSGQFGHIVVSGEGPECNCGRIGCVETFSSGTALGGLVAQAGLPGDTRAEDLLDAARGGDDTARRVLHSWAAPMRRAIESLVAVADPRLVLIGGGLGRQMAEALAGTGCGSRWFALPVEPARLGDDAGVIGAGLRALDDPPGAAA
jgi:glucokinase